MSITGITGIDTSGFSTRTLNGQDQTRVSTAFDTLFDSAVSMYRETDALQDAAEESEINFALGYATSTHDLAIAQQKANIALQYTTKVTNKALEAFKELMQMQI